MRTASFVYTPRILSIKGSFIQFPLSYTETLARYSPDETFAKRCNLNLDPNLSLYQLFQYTSRRFTAPKNVGRKSFSFGSGEEKISSQNEKVLTPLFTKTRKKIAAFIVPKFLKATLRKETNSGLIIRIFVHEFRVLCRDMIRGIDRRPLIGQRK